MLPIYLDRTLMTPNHHMHRNGNGALRFAVAVR
jgi:hypothetical protein